MTDLNGVGNYQAVCVSVVLVIHIYRRHCKVSIDISNFTDINTDINTHDTVTLNLIAQIVNTGTMLFKLATCSLVDTFDLVPPS